MEFLLLFAKITITGMLLGLGNMFFSLFNALVLTTRRIRSNLESMEEIARETPQVSRNLFQGISVRLFDALVLNPKWILSKLALLRENRGTPQLSSSSGNFFWVMLSRMVDALVLTPKMIRGNSRKIPEVSSKKTQHKGKQVHRICFHQGKYKLCRGNIQIRKEL